MVIELILAFFFRLLIIIFLGTILIVGTFLIIRAYQIKAKNLYIVGMVWIIYFCGQLLNQLLQVHVAIYAIFSRLSFILMVVFTNLTFYKDQKSILPKLVLALAVIFGIIAWYYDSVRDISQTTYILSRVFDFIHASICFNWLAFSCFSAYKNFKNVEIAPWIKIRYKLTYISSPILTLSYLALMFHPYDLPFGDISSTQSFIVYGLVSILILTYGIAFTLAWIMPNWLKKYLNRGYHTVEDEEISEEELMKLIKKQISKEGPLGNN